MVALANFRRVHPEQGAFIFFFSLRCALRQLLFFVSSHNPFSTQTVWCRLVKKFLFIYVFILGITVKKYLQNNGNTDAIIFLH